jgi:hypothetical protein
VEVTASGRAAHVLVELVAAQKYPAAVLEPREPVKVPGCERFLAVVTDDFCS